MRMRMTVLDLRLSRILNHLPQLRINAAEHRYTDR